MNTRPATNLERIDATAAAWVGRRDAGLTETERAELEQWLAANPLHAEALARFDSTWSALGRPRRTGTSAALAQELDTLDRGQRRRRSNVAVGLVAVLLAGLAWWIQPPALDQRTPPASPPVVLLPERRILPDGSTVEFTVGTEIVVDFSDRVRRVGLKRGEAHFLVVKDNARAFVVDAAGVEIRAVGTAFAVQLGRSVVEVLVTEGKVAVEQAVAPTEGMPRESRSLATVEAGERVVVDTGAMAARSEPVPVIALPEAEMAERLAWRSPRVEFSGTPLAGVIDAINQFGREKFVVDDPELATTALSGLFRADDTEAVVQMLEKGFGVYAERRDGRIFLRKAR